MKKLTYIIMVLAFFSCHSNTTEIKGKNETSNSSSITDVKKSEISTTFQNSNIVSPDKVPEISCEKTLLTTIENFKVWKFNNLQVIAFQAKLAIDADGSPRAYCPGNKGLDFTANAGKEGNWYGVVTDNNGNPVIQNNGDPSPGCYVSPTTLNDKKLAKENPLKYVNSEQIPFIALPSEVIKPGNIRIGDFAFAYNVKNGKSCFAIFADGGPKGKLGEGSIFLADKLGVNSNPRNGGASDGIIYIVFPGTGKGNGYLRTLEEINSIGKAEMDKLGGMQLIDCLK
jgi:hypothetical protein